MPTPDFRFNGPSSYSPLLSALADAPANRAKLQILQEQNQRQRLSDLLTQMSSAASIARNIQLIHQQGVEQKAREDTAKTMNPQNRNLFLGNQAFGNAYGGMAGTGAGIETMFGGGQQVAPQPNLQGEGVTPNDMGVDPQALIRKMKLKAVGTSYHTETNPNTGEQYQVTDSPIGLPPEKINYPTDNSTGVEGKPQLPPKLMEAANTAKEKFQSRSDVTTNISDLALLDQIEAGVKSNNPAAVQNLIIERARTGGLPGGRVTSGTQASEVGSQQFGAKIGRYWKKTLTGQLTASDKADYLDQIQNQRNVSAKQIIDAHQGVAKEVAKQYGIALPVAKKIVGAGLESQMGKYNPNYRPIYNPNAGMTKIQASDGSMHMIPSNNLSKAKKIDPRLKVIE